MDSGALLQVLMSMAGVVLVAPGRGGGSHIRGHPLRVDVGDRLGVRVHAAWSDRDGGERRWLGGAVVVLADLLADVDGRRVLRNATDTWGGLHGRGCWSRVLLEVPGGCWCFLDDGGGWLATDGTLLSAGAGAQGNGDRGRVRAGLHAISIIGRVAVCSLAGRAGAGSTLR